MKIICILAGGSGNRFGSPVPKQYHLINGRPVIEYVIDAAIKSVADEVIVVADAEKIETLEEKYGVIAVRGGRNRNKSIGNALSYIKNEFTCEEIIIVDAVCPMVEADLFDLYFNYLEKYDAVLTAEDVTTGLARKDGEAVYRNDYFLIESPDAYRFNILECCFNPDTAYTTPLHLLPKHANIKYYFDFKNYKKIMYPHDLAVAEALIRERERHVRFEAHSDDAVLALFAKLRKMDRKGTKQWEKQLDTDVESLFSKWEIYEFSVNRDAYTGLVLECKSRRFGNVVLKMYPPFLSGRFIKESFIMSTLKDYPLAPVLALDREKNAMLLSRVIPGDYIVYEDDQKDIEKMFLQMQQNRIPVSEVNNKPSEIKGVVEQTEDEYLIASSYNYYPDMVKYLLDCAKRIYEHSFLLEKKYLLHGDVYYKNALRSERGILAIDPVGYADAFVFEYMPLLTYELVMHTKPENYIKQYNELLSFFETFADISKFNEAVFVFLVKQLVPSIYEANDGYARANSYMQLIKELYLNENNEVYLEKATEE